MKTTRLQENAVDGFLHEPSAAAKCAAVITHGAGSNCEAPLLAALANTLCETGLLVLRCNLAFRQKRRVGPPSPATGDADRASLLAAVDVMRQRTDGPILLGGHSYGGRQATMLAAQEPTAADCLLLLSYPLHPPAKPEQLRTAHFPNLRTPSFFVHGAKDPFGSIAEMTTALSVIPARHCLIVADRKGHDLGGARFNFRETGLTELEMFFPLA